MLKITIDYINNTYTLNTGDVRIVFTGYDYCNQTNVVNLYFKPACGKRFWVGNIKKAMAHDFLRQVCDE